MPTVCDNWLCMEFSVIVANRKEIDLTVEVSIGYLSRSYVYSFTCKPILELEQRKDSNQ